MSNLRVKNEYARAKEADDAKAMLEIAERHLNTLADWEPFNECFLGSNIKIMDLDGLVERHGRVLFLENKPAGMGEVLHGQRAALAALGGFSLATVFVLYWNEGKITHISRSDRDPELQVREPCTTEDAKGLIKSWYKQSSTRQWSTCPNEPFTLPDTTPTPPKAKHAPASSGHMDIFARLAAKHKTV